MNLERFNKLMMEKGSPAQNPSEWRMFLEVCEMYLKKHKIKNPIVVELGIKRNRQKKFYEQFLGAEHIGIDISKKQSNPDIQGNTHDSKTLIKLKSMLEGKAINILFIDALHLYEDVKKDYEMYSPLCSDIIVLHDIKLMEREVWKFWSELIAKECKDLLFLTIYQCAGLERQAGIGMIIKRRQHEFNAF